MKKHQVVGDSTWVCIADKADEVFTCTIASLYTDCLKSVHHKIAFVLYTVVQCIIHGGTKMS